MNCQELLDRDLTDEEREIIVAVYHEHVVEWVMDAFVYPVVYLVSLWCGMTAIDVML